MMKIAVYCGAKLGNDQDIINSIVELSNEMIKRDIVVTYGGGDKGLMGLLAKNTVSNGGFVNGVIPEFLQIKEGKVTGIDNLEVVENMAQRKQRLLDLSDICVAMPGGPGTLEEIVEAYSWNIINHSSNPCIYININGYYDPMKNMYKKMFAMGFLDEENFNKLYFFDTVEDFMYNLDTNKIDF